MNNPVKILFITHYSSLYGANLSLCSLVTELKSKYNITPIVLLRKEGPLRNYLLKNDIKCYVFPFYWWLFQNEEKWAKLKSIIKQFRNIWRIVVIYRNLRNENIRCIYSNSFTVNIGILLKLIIHCPHIWHIRESLEQFQFKFALGKYFSMYLLRKGAGRYILISDYLVHCYVDFLPYDKVFRVYNGIHIKPIGSGIQVTNGHIHLGILGLISEQKNQLDALKAIDILINRNKKNNLTLHIAGASKKDYLEELKDFITRNNLESNVVIHGHLDNTHPFFSTIHLGLMCSKGEPFGRVTIEFMMYGIPVIASNSGANPEIMVSGITGYLYETGDPQDLADKIELFINDPQLLRQIGDTAYNYAVNNFSSDRNTSEVYQIINKELETYYS